MVERSIVFAADDLAFLRSLPGSTEPPIEGSRDQRARADRLPAGLLHRGRRTPLGDVVVSMAERADAAEARLRDLLAPADDVDVDAAVDAAEVLRLGEMATPGPWRVEGQAIRADLPGGIELRWGTAAYPKDNDFTAYTRTAAPRLARALLRARDQLRAAQLELRAADERQSDALASLHDRIEDALSAALGHVPVDDCDDKPAAADLEGLIDLAGRYKRAHDKLAEGAPETLLASAKRTR